MTQQWLPFRDVFTVVLDGSGTGTIEVRPSIGEWLIEQVAVRTSSNVNEPEFSAFINGAWVGGTFSGSRDSDTSFNQRLNAQERFNGIWTGGDAGATGELTLTGRKLV